MVTRIGHVALHVRDIDRSIAFLAGVLGLRVTLRDGDRAYLTCNERHHELILIASGERGYDHVALEVADLERAEASLRAAGAQVVAYEDEPGVEGALRAVVPGGHVVKLFAGMQHVPDPAGADRPLKFEHVSLKVRNTRRLERFLSAGLGFRFSDRMGFLASWWHCDADHHGMAVVWAPKAELSHYAYTLADLNAMGRTADRLKLHRDRKLIFGPSRHGPGNNQFAYFNDDDGAMVELCSDLAQMEPAGGYQPRKWPIDPGTINQWGGPPPLKFLLAGCPIAPRG